MPAALQKARRFPMGLFVHHPFLSGSMSIRLSIRTRDHEDAAVLFESYHPIRVPPGPAIPPVCDALYIYRGRGAVLRRDADLCAAAERNGSRRSTSFTGALMALTTSSGQKRTGIQKATDPGCEEGRNIKAKGAALVSVF